MELLSNRTTSLRPNEKIAYAKAMIGHQGYAIYKQWLRTKHANSKIPSYETFIDSRFFTSCIRVAEQAKKLKVDVGVFIDVVMKNYPLLTPMDWMTKNKYNKNKYELRSELYSLYVREYKKYASLEYQVIRTVTYIEKKRGLSIAEFFRVTSYNEMRHLLWMNEISIFYLLLSDIGNKWLRSLETDDLQLLSDDVNLEETAAIMNKNGDLLEELRQLISDIE